MVVFAHPASDDRANLSKYTVVYVLLHSFADRDEENSQRRSASSDDAGSAGRIRPAFVGMEVISGD